MVESVVKPPEKKEESWINSKWRPAMGWLYMGTCACDFVIFPVLWSVLQALQGGQVTSQWNPITLQGAGLYHLAMGAVLGVAAWSRGQEKMAAANMTPSMSPRQTTYTQTQTTTYRPPMTRTSGPDTDMEDADNLPPRSR